MMADAYPAVKALRDLSAESLMAGAAVHNDRAAREQYLDFVTAIAEGVLSCESLDEQTRIDAARGSYIGLYAMYARIPDAEIESRFGADILAANRQTGAFENEIKLGRSGEAVKPFLPGVQERLAVEMIVAAEKYASYDRKADPQVMRHYLSALLTGVRTLDDENLAPSLRRSLNHASRELAAMVEKYGGPAFIEGASLSEKGEVRKPGGPN